MGSQVVQIARTEYVILSLLTNKSWDEGLGKILQWLCVYIEVLSLVSLVKACTEYFDKQMNELRTEKGDTPAV